MDALPNEMLAEIFSWLEPEDLLGPVALVCKLWNTITKWKASWRQISISSTVPLHSLERYMRLAPYVDYLDVRVLTEGSSYVKVEEALLNCRPVVHKLELGIWSEGDDWYHLLLKVLRKFAPHVSSLSIGLGECSACYSEVGENNVKTTIYSTIASMNLTELKLRGDVYYQPTYSGELRIGLANLKSFKVSNFFWNQDSLGLSPAIDTIAAKAKRLRTLKLYLYSLTFPQGLVNAVKSCSNLNVIHLPVEYLHITQHMSHVYSIGILIDCLHPGLVDDACVKIENCSALKVVEELVIVSHGYGLFGFTWNPVLKYLGNQCQNVQSLTIKGEADWEHTELARLWRKMDQLKEIRFIGRICNKIGIRSVSRLPSLKYLDLSHYEGYEPYRGVFLKQIMDISKRRPNVKIVPPSYIQESGEASSEDSDVNL